MSWGWSGQIQSTFNISYPPVWIFLFLGGWSFIHLIKSKGIVLWPSFVVKVSVALLCSLSNQAISRLFSNFRTGNLWELGQWLDGTQRAKHQVGLSSAHSQPGVAELITPNFTLVTPSNYPTDICAASQKQLRHLQNTLINILFSRDSDGSENRLIKAFSLFRSLDINWKKKKSIKKSCGLLSSFEWPKMTKKDEFSQI